MPAPEIIPENNQAKCHRNACNDEENQLRPCLGILSPGWKIVSWCQMPGSVEYLESRCNHSKNDKTAAEVDPSEHKFGHPYSDFDFQILRLLLFCGFLLLLQHLLFPECWAQGIVDPSSWSARHLHGTLQRRTRRERDLNGLSRWVILRDVAEANI